MGPVTLKHLRVPGEVFVECVKHQRFLLKICTLYFKSFHSVNLSSNSIMLSRILCTSKVEINFQAEKGALTGQCCTGESSVTANLIYTLKKFETDKKIQELWQKQPQL